MTKQAALLIVDIQNDFCPGGALAVPGGDEIIDAINRYGDLFRGLGFPIFASRDWHPEDARHFKGYGGRWPSHCIRGTSGADFHPRLILPSGTVVISKGTDRSGDGYSCFEGTTPDAANFGNVLHDYGIRTLFIGGLATDYCVKESVLDALRFGFDVVVLEDATRGVDVAAGDSLRAIAAMTAAGARIGTFETVARELSSSE